MGKHDAPNQPWVPLYRGYQCEGCGGVWASVQLDEGVIPAGLFCLATEHCRGPIVALIPTEESPPDRVPVIFQWFKPKNVRFVNEPYLDEHIRNDGLLSRPVDLAPDWVKARIGYFGGVRTF